MQRRRTSVEWPTAVDDRLNYLVSLAQGEGERVSRSELLSALVHAAPQDGEGLGVMVRTYRRCDDEDLRPPTDPGVPRYGRPRQEVPGK